MSSAVVISTIRLTNLILDTLAGRGESHLPKFTASPPMSIDCVRPTRESPTVPFEENARDINGFNASLRFSRP